MTNKTAEPVVFSGHLKIPYKFEAGMTGTRFLKELRDNKRIMGLKCSKCNRVYVPPRSTCKECFSLIDEWVEVSNEGKLLTYTVLRTRRDAEDVILGRHLPVAYGIIKLDGADTGFVHMLGEVDFDKLRVGMKVKAVFEEERTGNILDINYFKPVS
ncbi:MAG: Zn-ribbon domain-containing OB-fold protein [Chloroflexota bacterium]|nr:Zn-ribbon domain-containing OB-fold protein [Chloroflexota bacterium]